MRSIRIAVLFLVLAAVSCGGDSSLGDLAKKCVSPRPGTSDRQGTLDDEKGFLKAWTDAYYLWYREVPALNMHDPKYVDAITWFDDLKTTAVTSTNHPKDKFHFTVPTDVWNQESQAGITYGYGVSFAALASPCATGGNGCRPRDWRVAYTEPNAPPAGAALLRGARIMAIDGEDFVNGTNVDKLNAGLSPATVGEQHVFSLLDPGQTTPHDVTLTSAAVTETPVVPTTLTLSATDKVGYIHFKDHIATSESQLIAAISQFKSDKVSDLVLDMRYNGGGLLYIASELAYMIAGPTQTSGKFFERLTFNDKYGNTDPIGGSNTTTPFYNSSTTSQALPHLDLSRVFILTGPGTCSASESVINGLQGAGVQVIQIGSTTCGKPYGFYPQDNCGTTYFSIQFKGVNYLGFGDYTDGFVAGAGGSNPAGCQVADDFSHQLGDPAEGRLAAALAWRANPVCPAALTAGPMDGIVSKSAWRTNRILGGR